uniref:Gluconokinase n=1 Tax=Panagrolaimus sp. JU765 TaxID=591449 RepID=A0AC34QH54_9BILA
MTSKEFIIVGGVSGCGKSTVGQALAEKLKVEFIDGDKFHPKENIAKMSSGIPLNDDDRHGWLENLSTFAKDGQSKVVACSALKRSYRRILASKSSNYRIVKRQGHFMKAKMLKSQLETLELPSEDENGFTFAIDGDKPVDDVINDIISHLEK